MEAEKKVWTEEEIRYWIDNSVLWVERGVLAIHSNQTDDEQSEEQTRHKNRMGWSAYDAQFGSSLANQLNTGRRLTSKQILSARKMLQKYLNQLNFMANHQ